MRQVRTSWCRRGCGIAAAMMVLALAACGRAAGGSQSGGAAEEAPWAAHIRTVDEALAQKNVSAAELAWHHAYGAARFGSRSWDAMLAVGDAALRIGEAVGARQAPAAKARTLYLAALFRARQQGSVEGVLRTAEAFRALGDHEVVDQCLAVAERLIAQRPEVKVRQREAALVERFSARLRGAETVEVDLF